MTHLSICASQDDTMAYYPVCDCGAEWSVFNSGGACVADGVTRADAEYFLTEARLARGWVAIGCTIIQAKDDAQMTAKTPAERKADERQRRADAGLVRLEVYAHPDDHAAIKELAAKLQRKRARRR